MFRWKLLTVLLAVLVESCTENSLKLNGSSTHGYYQPLKIHPNMVSTNVQSVRERTGNPVFNSMDVMNNVKRNELSPEQYKVRTPETPSYNSDEVGKKSISGRSQGSHSLIDNVLGYLNLGAQRDDDFGIYPELEHLPEQDPPKIDPEFEHLPSTDPSNSLEDESYDFPTQEHEVEIPPENFQGKNLQRVQMLNTDQNTTTRENAVSDEEYYFDNYIDRSESVNSDTTNIHTIDLESTSDNNEQNGSETNSVFRSSDSSTQATPAGNVEAHTSDDPNGYVLDEGEYDYFLGNDLIHHSLKNSFFDNVDGKFRSSVFNPVASPHEKFQECKTPRNESGHCRYVQHCFLPNIISSLGSFMRYVCIIQERFIGICCPEFPVHTLEVQWQLPAEELQVNATENVAQPESGCGISSKTRIVGGVKADPKEWPWMAALLSKTVGNFFCGGSLINSKYVLTAAHCTFRVPRNQILVRLGEYDFSDSSDGPGEDYPVVEIKRHALYSRKTLRNDIALLKLARSAKFGPFVSTICLPKSNALYVGQMVTLAGWGNTKGGGQTSKVLMEASFPVWSNAECSDAQGIPIRKTFLCAGSREKDKGACNGDSGGPLMLLDNSTKLWKTIGIVSWGRRGCDPEFPTVFTRVSKYLRWIKIHSSD